MLKTSLIAALLCVGATGAFADQYTHHHNAYNRYNGPNSPGAYTGINRFCGPGEIPQSFPTGNGVRCELPSGGYRYN